MLEHKPASSELRAAVAGWLESGEWRGVPLDLSGVSQFQRAVLRGASAIPRGELRTYSELAAEIGKPKAVRAVGNALARNPLPLFIPCHRVVRSSGALGGYAFGLPLKMRLLQYEGALPTRGRAG